MVGNRPLTHGKHRVRGRWKASASAGDEGLTGAPAPQSSLSATLSLRYVGK